MQEIEHTRSTYEHSQGAVAIQGEKVQGDTNMVRKSSTKVQGDVNSERRQGDTKLVRKTPRIRKSKTNYDDYELNVVEDRIDESLLNVDELDEEESKDILEDEYTGDILIITAEQYLHSIQISLNAHYSSSLSKDQTEVLATKTNEDISDIKT